jgi:hypothetical protein
VVDRPPPRGHVLLEPREARVVALVTEQATDGPPDVRDGVVVVDTQSRGARGGSTHGARTVLRLEDGHVLMATYSAGVNPNWRRDAA